jgi:hypothetical protein
LLAAPEDREPAVRKVIEAAGGKVISFYFTTGETDFLLISEADESEAIIAAPMAAALGTVFPYQHRKGLDRCRRQSNRERAAKAASAYRPPGKR